MTTPTAAPHGHVVSKDGTRISFDWIASGAPLILGGT
jgi:hypothetical protein